MCNHDLSVGWGCLDGTSDVLDQLGDLRLEVFKGIVGNISERVTAVFRNVLEDVDELVEDNAESAVVIAVVISGSEGSESSDSGEEDVLELHF
jgi:hypothetical protein